MKEFILWENENVIFYGNLENDEKRLEFKPNCPKEIKKMWAILNKPIRRAL